MALVERWVLLLDSSTGHPIKALTKRRPKSNQGITIALFGVQGLIGNPIKPEKNGIRAYSGSKRFQKESYLHSQQNRQEEQSENTYFI